MGVGVSGAVRGSGGTGARQDVRVDVSSKVSKIVPDQAFGRDYRICNRNRPTPHVLELTYLLNVRVLQALANNV